MVSCENKDIYADNMSDIDCSERGLDVDNIDNDIDNSDSDSFIQAMRWTQVFPLPITDDERENDYKEEITPQWIEVDIPPTIEPVLDRTGLNILPQNGVEGSLDVFLDDKFYKVMVTETNRYRHQNVGKCLKKKKAIKWTDLTVSEFKKFLGLLILMSQTRKSTMDEYWTTDPLLETPIFPKTMSRDRFKQIWRWWHFVNNEEMDELSDHPFKIRPVYDSLIEKFNTVQVEYNNYVKGVDRADQYLSYYSILRKTKKWSKRAVMYLLNCAFFNSYLVHNKHNNSSYSYKKFLLELSRCLINEKHTKGLELMDIKEQQCGTSNSAPRTPRYKIDPPGRLSLDLKKHNLIRIENKGKRLYAQRSCVVCAAHKKRKLTCYKCEFCNAPLHRGECYQTYHTVEKY